MELKNLYSGVKHKIHGDKTAKNYHKMYIMNKIKCGLLQMFAPK